MPFRTDVPQGFTTPTALPESEAEQQRWQMENRAWWERNPMRYDWKSDIQPREFSREFYTEIDRRFFDNVREFMPWRRVPFDPLIDFAALAGQDVLEIGVGSGSHAQLLAEHARSFTGIDLTEYAVRSTSERMRCFGLDNATIRRMDAEHMDFPDESFDFIWSWGVIHHSANTGQVLREMHRVLRPGGRAVTMVYNRSFWIYYVLSGFFHGVLRGELLRTRSLHEVLQRWTDGAIARYYTPAEWRAFTAELFTVEDVRVYGSKLEVLPLPAGRLKDTVARLLPDRASRLVTNDLRQGSFLVSTLRKA